MSLKNPVTPTGIDPGTVRLVGQRLNHYANPGPSYISTECNVGVLRCESFVEITDMRSQFSCI
jgi:hypothetical protein